MDTSDPLANAVDTILSEQWPEADLLDLTDTYQQLNYIDELYELVEFPKDSCFYDKDSDINIESFELLHHPTVFHTRPEAIQRVQEYRTTLWKRAEILSRHKLRSLTILDLPSELIETVFDNLEYSSADARYDYQGFINQHLVNRQTICNVRLVSRRMNELASPYLFRNPRINLDQASLDFITHISHQPFLARGVQKLFMDLRFCPKEFGEKTRVLQRYLYDYVLEPCNSACEQEYWSSKRSNSSFAQSESRLCEQAMKNCSTIREAWLQGWTEWTAEERSEMDSAAQIHGFPSDYMYLDDDEKVSMTEEHFEYQQILKDTRQWFKEQNDNQARLIEEGVFCQTIASAMTRMPFARSIEIVDASYGEESHFRDSARNILLDKKALSGALQRPLTWGRLELQVQSYIEPPWNIQVYDFLPAALLSDLPIALHKAGVELREFRSGVFPKLQWLDQIQVPPDARSKELCAAVQSFEVLVIEPNFMVSRIEQEDYIESRVGRFMTEYLGAMLSNQNLREVNIQGDNIGDYDCPRGRQDPFKFGSTLSGICLPNVKKLNISGFILSQAELEQFCRGLSFEMTELTIKAFHIDNGSWVTILELLRQRVFTDRKHGKCDFGWSRVRGGEFPRSYDDADDEDSWEPFPEMPLVIQAEEYIKGILTENPLRGPE